MEEEACACDSVRRSSCLLARVTGIKMSTGFSVVYFPLVRALNAEPSPAVPFADRTVPGLRPGRSRACAAKPIGVYSDEMDVIERGSYDLLMDRPWLPPADPNFSGLIQPARRPVYQPSGIPASRCCAVRNPVRGVDQALATARVPTSSRQAACP